MITTINQEEFEQFQNAQGLQVLKIGAEWCAACKAIHPVMENMSGNYNDVKFYDMDADKNQDFVLEMGVRALPSFVFYKDGKELAVEKGLNHITLKKKIEEFK